MENISSHMSRDLYYRITSLEACDPQEIFSAEISEIVEKPCNPCRNKPAGSLR